MITVYHTSPAKIEKIKPHQGHFSGALFFSATEYAMGPVKAIYSINLEDDQIIEVSDLDNTEVVAEVVETVQSYLDMEIDEDEALDLLTGYSSIWDIAEASDSTDIGEFDWALQGLQAKAARNMGYLAAESIDEQGTVYIINMIGRENLLKLEREE